MPDSRHELEIIARTKDLASQPLKSIGAEGQKAGQKITRGMKQAGAASKQTAADMLKINESSAKITGVAGSSFAALSAGMSAAAADADNLEMSMVSVGASVATAFAAGGPIGAGIALLSVGIGALIGASKKAEKAERARAAAAKRAAEEAKRAAEARRQQAEAQQDYVDSIEKEIRLLNARNEEERRSIENAYKRQEAYERGGSEGYLKEIQRQRAEERKRIRDADAAEEKRIADESARRAEESARRIKEHEKQLAQARKAALELLEDQARARFDALTLTSEEARAAADLALIRELEAKGAHDLAKALKEALKYDKERRELAEDEKKDQAKAKKDDAEAKKAEQARKAAAAESAREAASRDRIVQALKDQLAIEKEVTEEGQERVRQEQEIRDLRKEGGEEAVKLYRELMKLREEERKKTEAGIKREEALRRGENPNKGRKARRREALHRRKQRREAAQRTGRSIEDSRMGPFGPMRIKEGGESPSRWMEMDRRKLEETYGDNLDQVLEARGQGPRQRDNGNSRGSGPARPSLPGQHATPITPDAGTPPKDFRDSDFVPNLKTTAEKLKFLEDLFGQSEANVEQIARNSEETAEAAEGFQGELGDAEKSFTEMAGALKDGFTKLETFATTTTESNTAVVGAVERVGSKLDRLINQLKQAQVISGSV